MSGSLWWRHYHTGRGGLAANGERGEAKDPNAAAGSGREGAVSLEGPWRDEAYAACTTGSIAGVGKGRRTQKVLPAPGVLFTPT